MSQSLRDQIRGVTVGAAVKFKSKTLNYKGFDVEFRQPTVKARRDLFDKSANDKGGVDILDFLVWGVIFNTYVPDTDELVFEDSDYASLVSKPTGGFMDLFGAEVSALLNVEEDLEKK